MSVERMVIGGLILLVVFSVLAAVMIVRGADVLLGLEEYDDEEL